MGNKHNDPSVQTPNSGQIAKLGTSTKMEEPMGEPNLVPSWVERKIEIEIEREREMIHFQG